VNGKINLSWLDDSSNFKKRLGFLTEQVETAWKTLLKQITFKIDLDKNKLIVRKPEIIRKKRNYSYINTVIS
jgi:hypothetical protein